MPSSHSFTMPKWSFEEPNSQHSVELTTLDLQHPVFVVENTSLCNFAVRFRTQISDDAASLALRPREIHGGCHIRAGTATHSYAGVSTTVANRRPMSVLEAMMLLESDGSDQIDESDGKTQEANMMRVAQASILGRVVLCLP